MCYQEEMSVFFLGSGCRRPDEANWCRFSAYFNQMVGVFAILIGTSLMFLLPFHMH